MNINRQLLDDCRSGDQKAQYQLYRSCFPLLMSVCLRYKKEESEAVASLNAGFLKILNGLARYRPDVPFEAWIRRIMINTIIDEFRKDRQVRELIDYKDFSNAEENYFQQVDYNKADQQFDAEQLEALIHRLAAGEPKGV